MLTRRLIGASLIVLCSVGTVFGLRRAFNKPVDERAPAFRVKGAPAPAKITVVEFSDFECPACRAAEEPIANFLKAYPDARFVFKNFPLERIHPWALPAAEVAECAGRQGKFWPVHDSFYKHQPEWAQSPTPEQDLQKLAESHGVDAKQLQSCLQDPATKAAIESDVQEGRNRWVYSTPTFFVNGKRFIGGQQLAEMAPLWLDKHLKK